MRLIKTNEKILVWMHRNKITGKDIADEIGITRQAWSAKMKENIFSVTDMMVLKRLGFNE